MTGSNIYIYIYIGLAKRFHTSRTKTKPRPIISLAETVEVNLDRISELLSIFQIEVIGLGSHVRIFVGPQVLSVRGSR